MNIFQSDTKLSEALMQKFESARAYGDDATVNRALRQARENELWDTVDLMRSLVEVEDYSTSCELV